jgi:hypothetical protein
MRMQYDTCCAYCITDVRTYVHAHAAAWCALEYRYPDGSFSYAARYHPSLALTLTLNPRLSCWTTAAEARVGIDQTDDGRWICTGAGALLLCGTGS